MPSQPTPRVGASALIRFAGEVGMFAVLAYVGAAVADGAMAFVLPIVLPLLAVAGWGAFVGPRAALRWTDPARLLLEVVFGAACAGLVVAGQWPWAVALAAAYAGGFPHRRAEAALHQ